MNKIIKRPELNELSEEGKESSGWTLTVILIVIFAIWAIAGWLVSSLKNPGEFGDMFGAVNALFSGFAFATLIYTVFLQRKELSLQRKELEYTRIELKRSATAQESSEATLRAQAVVTAESANLAATNILLTYYGQAILELMHRQRALEKGVEPKIEFLKERQLALLAILEDNYQRITAEHTAKRQADLGIAAQSQTPTNRSSDD